jgi:hypothetical protein
VVSVAAYASSQSQVVSLQTPRRPVYASTTVVLVVDHGDFDG